MACENVTTPLLAIAMASRSLALPIRPPSLMTKSPATVKSPILLKLAVSAAAALAAVLNDNLVALLDALKSPSDIAAMPAATNTASVPAPSAGA